VREKASPHLRREPAHEADAGFELRDRDIFVAFGTLT